MNILQVIPHYVPAYRFGGPQYVAHSLSKALIAAGHRVVVCTTNLADDICNLNVPRGPVDVDGVTVYYEPTTLSRYWGFSTILWKTISREIVNADVVLIHAHYQFANWAGARLARKFKKPYIIFAHGSLHRQGIAHKNSFFKKAYLRLFEHQNIHHAMFLAFNAIEEKSYSLYQEMGKVVPSGIDPTEFESVIPDDYFRKQYPELLGKTYFLFLGRLDIKHKGLDLLIPAFARLLREYPNAHLVLAGPDESRGVEIIRKLAQENGINEQITLPGLITGRDKVAALKEADVFLLPSRFEGLSIALLEALYIGVPVLVTDQVGLSNEISKINAGIVVSANTEAIYGGLLHLADPSIRESIRGRGTNLIIQSYSWHAIARDLINQIKVLIK